MAGRGKDTTEIKRKLMELKKQRLKLEAPLTFSCFLGYSNSK